MSNFCLGETISHLNYFGWRRKFARWVNKYFLPQQTIPDEFRNLNFHRREKTFHLHTFCTHSRKSLTSHLENFWKFVRQKYLSHKLSLDEGRKYSRSQLSPPPKTFCWRKFRRINYQEQVRKLRQLCANFITEEIATHKLFPDAASLLSPFIPTICKLHDCGSSRQEDFTKVFSWSLTNSLRATRKKYSPENSQKLHLTNHCVNFPLTRNILLRTSKLSTRKTFVRRTITQTFLPVKLFTVRISSRTS